MNMPPGPTLTVTALNTPVACSTTMGKLTGCRGSARRDFQAVGRVGVAMALVCLITGNRWWALGAPNYDRFERIVDRLRRESRSRRSQRSSAANSRALVSAAELANAPT